MMDLQIALYVTPFVGWILTALDFFTALDSREKK